MNIAISNKISNTGIKSAIYNYIPDCMPWNSNECNLYDLFDIHNPRILIIDESEVIDDLSTICEEKESKLVIFGNNPEKLTIKPHVFCTFSDAYSPDFFILNLKDCIDSINTIGKKMDIYESDVSFINTKQVITKEVRKLIHDLYSGNFRFKAYNTLNVVGGIGFLRKEEYKNVIASSKIIIDLEGTMLLDAGINKAFCVTTLDNYRYPSCKLENMKEVVENWLFNKRDDLDKTIDRMYKVVITSNLCTYTVETILKALDEHDISKYLPNNRIFKSDDQSENVDDVE